MKRLVFDLDGTLCTETGNGDYENAAPILRRIARVNTLYDAGDRIIIDTGRAESWRAFTEKRLRQWNVKYHELHVGRKPFGHVYVDTTAVQADEFFAGHADRWPDEYFAQRVGNDPNRARAFEGERLFLLRNRAVASEILGPLAICDVGCSTGEFLGALRLIDPAIPLPNGQVVRRNDWHRLYGMEISAHARRIAETHGISFARDILNTSNFFDAVIFRGTIQHLPHPFRYIERAFTALKPGGHVAFLATPNAGSLCYRLWQELPVSDDTRNYWMPSAKTLSNALTNFGFEIVAVEYPYLNGGYARPARDALAFARRLALGGKTNFPFPGNMLNLLARKPQ